MNRVNHTINVLFLDFDGVIIESVGVKTEAFRELFEVYIEQVDDIVAYHLRNNGVSRFVKFTHIYEHILGLPFDESTRETVGRRFSEIVFNRVVGCSLVPGAEALLNEFSGRIPMYVISATPEEELRRVVAARGLADYFENVHGTPGTKAGHIQRILGVLKLSPFQATLVGDSVEDFKAARVTGIHFIGRQNQESFNGSDFPISPDLFGVATTLRELMSR
jgi:phosphoglycolate phosphatase-like HAD superfamily hydrolase